METRKIGSLEVTVVGLGCNNFGMRCDEEQTKKVVDACIESGINFFDTADVYGATKSEEFLGKALGSRRDDVVVATKFGAPLRGPGTGGAKPDWVRQAVEDSLRRLGTDRIDLYQLHMPDASTPIEDTLEVLDELVRAGKVREIGNSNFSGSMIDAAEDASATKGFARFLTAQNHYNLLHRDPEDDVVPAAEKRGLGVLPYFPLASGFLSGKYRRGEAPPEGTRLAGLPEERRGRVLSDKHFDVLEGLEKFAAERGHTVLELAIAWLASQPAVASVISGATKPEQVAANAAAASWKLSDDELAEIDKISPR